MFVDPFTSLHTALSLIAIVVGIPVIADLVAGRVRALPTALFLVTAILTSVTGYGFPFHRLLPSHIVGAIALVVLALVLIARYGYRLAGAWRGVYAIGMVISHYLLIFVLIAQLFGKVPALNALAPTQSEPPFAIAQGIALLVFVVLGVLASRRFRPAIPAAA
ncbi:hypothetical protein GXW71_17650 [Roseomonas hellenica]|uniref:Uncharacterized protein n=1 Tax=Plastoroseomonas hellenica TaxID=2687306 RepID=A0ABS5F0Y8_9PROT|nr:hypothetical protein [Plastoroseomonas hellenica]MBR0666190.1 hypothetical protein [Plastoroseomonas hellenica]